MPTLRIFDDRGRPLLFGRPPQRIVSLVPSDTYSLVKLGGRERIVGRTDYCVEPADISSIPSVGGTKSAKAEDILALSPDLVIANQEENTRETLEALATERVPVLVSFPRRFEDGVAHLARFARILGVEGDAVAKALIREGYEALKASRADMPRVRVFAPIWLDPLMTMNRDTFMSDMLRAAGADNVFADRDRRYPLAADLGIAPVLPADRVAGRDTRYPRVTWDELIERAPDLILLPDEPYAFGETDQKRFLDLDTPASKRGAVKLVSGKDLCWPGAMAVEAYPRLRALIAESSALSSK